MSISGISAPTPSLSPAAQLAGLEAQIAQYQKQLADCVNCATASTISGQSAIDELSAKIDATRERLEAIAAVKSGDGAAQTEARRLAPLGALVDKFA